MNIFKKLQEHFAFTKNEQRVFFFLALTMLIGAGIKFARNYVGEEKIQRFDYSQTDSIFTEKSQLLNRRNDSLSVQSVRKVNINNATKSELVALPGIGEAMAERILLYRQDNGKFKNISELKKIKGIGEKKFDRLKEHIEIQ